MAGGKKTLHDPDHNRFMRYDTKVPFPKQTYKQVTQERPKFSQVPKE